MVCKCPLPLQQTSPPRRTGEGTNHRPLATNPEVNNVISKKNYDSEGQEVATFQGVGTGPWEFTESSTREFWKFAARENHYRKTPEFAELVLWDIPEEATRVPTLRPESWTAS